MTKRLCLLLCLSLCQAAWAQQSKPVTPKPSGPQAPKEDSKQRLERAKQAFERGVKALREKKTKEAIAALEEGVRLEPGSVGGHYYLGLAYAQAGQLFPKAWDQVRLAAFMQPRNKAIAEDFERLWSGQVGRGAANVGLSEKRLRKLLGTPNQVQEGKKNQRLVYGFMALNLVEGKLFSVMDLRPLKFYRPAAETLRFKTDGRDWKVCSRRMNKGSSLVEWVVPPETPQAWGSLLNTQRLLDLSARRMTPKQLMEIMKARITQRYPKAVWKVLKDEGTSILYEWVVPGKDGEPGQHELARLFAGSIDIHRLAYAEKGVMTAARRKTWLKILKEAYLVKTGR